MGTRTSSTDELAARYFNLFINRLAYNVQSPRPNRETGRHYYYRAKNRKDGRPMVLTPAIVRQHLEGALTIAIYAINPRTQRSKWVAIDADYEDALNDLLKLQWELKQDGVEAALEKSRRGGHLWIFAEGPLLARDCRVYIYNLAKRLRVPVKGSGLADGIEVFPRQDRVEENEFGNALRAPLGVHRGAGKRFWFYGADYTLEKQLAYLERLKRITAEEMSGFVRGLKMPEEFEPRPRIELPPYDPNRREFRILDHVRVRRRMGRDYWTRCPSCQQQGRDRSGDNLAISISDPRKYRCWAGCTREMIREALGCPIKIRTAS
jgi:hypothetical protein